MLRHSTILLLAIFLLITAGCSDESASTGTVASVASLETPAEPGGTVAPARSAGVPEASSAAPGRIADEPLERYQASLLEMAYSAASKFPLRPHVKNRSRAQERVVAACLELEQPTRALRYVDGIANWRRGAGYADYAYYCAVHGAEAEAEPYLARAMKVADEDARSATSQAWRRDRVRAKVARTYRMLGQPEAAARFESGLVESETGLVAEVRAMTLEEGAFDQEVAALVEWMTKGSLDHIKAALVSCRRFYDRFYDDGPRRARVQQAVDLSYDKLPIQLRIDWFTGLTDVALSHGDRDGARRFARNVRAIVTSNPFMPADHVQAMAGAIRLLARAGLKQEAREDAAATLAEFEKQRAAIVNIDRADAVRSLAEAYMAIGDRAEALALYRRALDEGVVNPNSRPRADDFVATCCSMALHGCKPDEAARARIREIHDGLGDPW